MQVNNTLSSILISSVRLPLAFMVVVIHSWGYPNECVIDWSNLDFAGIYNIIRIFCCRVFPSMAVPVFFLISGYLFFIKAERLDWAFYKRQWNKRLHTLFIPYVLWNLLSVLYSYVRKTAVILINGLSWSELDSITQTQLPFAWLWNSGQWYDASGPAIFALWFIRDLMIVVAFAPFIYWLISKTKGWIVVLFGLAYLFRLPVLSQEQTALFYFSIGAYYGIRKTDFAKSVSSHYRWLLPVWITAIAIGIYTTSQTPDLEAKIHNFEVLIGVSGFICLVTKCGSPDFSTKGRLLKFASENTFFIYVFHQTFALTFVWMTLERLPLPDVLEWVIAPFLTVGISLSVLWLMKRYIPRTTAILIGNR